MGIEGISGTSAGAMNAAVLAHGHAAGGAKGAKEALENFWGRVSQVARFSPFRRTPLDMMSGRWTMDTSPIFLAFDANLFAIDPDTLEIVLASGLDRDTLGVQGTLATIRGRPHLDALRWRFEQFNKGLPLEPNSETARAASL